MNFFLKWDFCAKNFIYFQFYIYILIKIKGVEKISSYISPTIEAAGGTGASDGPEPTPTAVVPFVAIAVAAVVFLVEAVDYVTTVTVATEANIVLVVSPGCFAEGTNIKMGDGSLKSIENVRAGDIVLAFDSKRKSKMKSKVSKTFYHAPNETLDYYLIINNSLRVTPNHPMWIEGVWKQAGELKVGDKLLNIDGKIVRVGSIEKIYDRIPVYNLEVDKYHTYFADGILVHNKDDFRRRILIGRFRRFFSNW